MSGFAAALQTVVPKARPLFLTHGTVATSVPSILANGRLQTKLCPTLGMDLVFLFYGRPDYQARDSNLYGRDLGRAPVYMLLEPTLVDAAANVYPFDTGGFSFYSAHIAPPLTRSDFALECILASPGRVVEHFYGSNHDYYEKQPRPDFDTSSVSAEVQSYYSLIIDDQISEGDNRQSAIEISINGDVVLEGHLRAVVVPQSLLSDANIMASLDQLGCRKLLYPVPGRFRPGQFESEIHNLIKDFMRDEGLFR